MISGVVVADERPGSPDPAKFDYYADFYKDDADQLTRLKLREAAPRDRAGLPFQESGRP